MEQGIRAPGQGRDADDMKQRGGRVRTRVDGKWYPVPYAAELLECSIGSVVAMTKTGCLPPIVAGAWIETMVDADAVDTLVALANDYCHARLLVS